ncbi:MAG: hypothetical protein AB7F35_15460 [Acetobacteraceae bacterium]
MTATASTSTSENDSTLAVRDTAGGSKNRTIAGAIKGLFRSVAKAITREEEEPKPEPRRRRSGETEGDFRKLGRKLARRFDPHKSFRRLAKKAARRRHRTMKLPAEAYTGAHAYLSHTLDWLNLWHHDAAASSEFSSSFDANSDHLSPHL